MYLYVVLVYASEQRGVFGIRLAIDFIREKETRRLRLT